MKNSAKIIRDAISLGGAEERASVYAWWKWLCAALMAVGFIGLAPMLFALTTDQEQPFAWWKPLCFIAVGAIGANMFGNAEESAIHRADECRKSIESGDE